MRCLQTSEIFHVPQIIHPACRLQHVAGILERSNSHAKFLGLLENVISKFNLRDQTRVHLLTTLAFANYTISCESDVLRFSQASIKSVLLVDLVLNPDFHIHDRLIGGLGPFMELASKTLHPGSTDTRIRSIRQRFKHVGNAYIHRPGFHLR